MLQYIGARYVPIFYQNSLDPTSSEWEVNVTYEPLTWVSMSNGYMYISKKEVPANIGSPASNPDYWLEAGQYNAYIQSLQDQIDDMKDGTVPGSLQDQINDIVNTDLPAITGDISNLQSNVGDLQTAVGNLKSQNRKMILIGDSYLFGGLGYPTYGTKLQALMPDSNIYLYPESGSGFAHAGVDGHTFGDLLAAAITDHTTDANDITDVIAIGGSNDINQTDGTMNTAFAAFYAAAHTAFPNAKYHIGFLGWNDMTVNSASKVTYIATKDQYLNLGAQNKLAYIVGLENLMHNYGQFFNSGHPNEACNGKVARYLFDYFTTGNAQLIEFAGTTLVNAAGFTDDAFIGGGQVYCTRRDGRTEVNIHGSFQVNSYGAFGYTFAAGTIASGGSLIKMADLSGGLVYGVDLSSYGHVVAQACTAWFYNGISWTAVPGSLCIVAAQLLFAPAQAFTDFSGFTGMRLPATKIVCDTMFA